MTNRENAKKRNDVEAVQRVCGLRELTPPKCKKCDGLGWYNDMGPNTFPVTCSACHGVASAVTNDDMLRAIYAKAPSKRTRSEVLFLRTAGAVFGGCCDRYADMSACDCLKIAKGGM